MTGLALQNHGIGNSMEMHIPNTTDLLLIGGGHTHALVLRQWGMKSLPGVRLTLVNPGPTAPYSGMLPGLIAGHYQQDELEIDLVKLARFAGARLILDRVTGLDTGQKLAQLANRPPIAYDIASVDIGITTELKSLPGFDEFTAPAKPLDAYASAWEQFVQEAQAGTKPPTAAVIGGGVAGVELAMAMAHRLRKVCGDRADIAVALIERGSEIVARAAKQRRRKLLAGLMGNGVKVMTDTSVIAATETGLDIADGTHLDAAFVTTAIGANPAPWLEETGLALKDGFIRVGPDLRATGHEDIFAVGDIAHMDESPRVKAGVFAVRQAPILHDNLIAAATGGALKSYRPQKDYLKLVSLGEKSALAAKWGLTLQHKRLWNWKNHIDQTFMAQFRELPEMTAPETPAGPMAIGVAELLDGQPLCGGCGSKVAQDILNRALEPLNANGDDAAVLRIGDTQQVITTDHFRAFTPDPYLLAQIIANHALGDVWAMGADPQAVLASIILPAMSGDLQERTLAEIIAGLKNILDTAGAELVGGHTSLGAEMTLGVTATGLMNGRTSIGLGGAKIGDSLILTKPIGTGTLLAAEMQGKANGRDAAAAYDLMLQSSALTSKHLREVAHAMTDVTGFGLAGHLIAMLDASSVQASLSLGAIPYCSGAIELAEAGIHSSIYPETSKHADRIEADNAVRSDPRFKLLFDPQTAGGLLAAVPGDSLSSTLDGLKRAGGVCWVIGEVTGTGVGLINVGP